MAAEHCSRLTGCCAWTGKQKLQQKAGQTDEERAALEAFNKITEAASALMDSGELDVYSGMREEFLRAAALFAPAADIFADDNDDDNMFGDDDAIANKVHESLGQICKGFGLHAS